MNERIRQLAIESDIMAPTWNHVPFGYQKFAELIVKECMDTIAESREARHTAYYYRNRVAEHFGVEL